MKAKLFFMSFLATALFASCSSDESVIITTEGGGDAIMGEPQFLSVNLVTSGESATGTRAGGDQVSGDPSINDSGDKATYEEGSETENKVTSIRFYFFNGNDPALVKNNGTANVNYLDWTSIESENNNMPNVEKILSAMLILQTPADAGMPETMVAIINPTSDLPADKISLSELKKKCGDYAKNASAGENASFIMSNSTYAENSTEMMEVNVKNHIMSSKDAAEAVPVDIYVERTVAKIRVINSLTAGKTLSDNNTILYDPSKKDESSNVATDPGQRFGEKKIYVKFLGWNATAVADNSRLIKKINPGWDGKLLGTFGPWNWPDYNRSFWAVNVNETDNSTELDYQYGTFQKTPEDKTIENNLFQAQAKTEFGKDNCVYVNENATDSYNNGNDASTPTKVIIAAQLVDENGAAIEFAEYASERMEVSALTTRFAQLLGYYKKTTDEDNKVVYTQMSAKDLKIVTATELNNNEYVESGRYKVYIQLTDEAKTADWYPTNNGNQQESDKLSAETINKTLKDLGSAKVWKDGYTYYYFDIEHGSKKGVVRNHIYDATLTSLVGLGTPVYNPDEIIYPEHPDKDTETYLAARINILSWRVVNNDVTLEW